MGNEGHLHHLGYYLVVKRDLLHLGWDGCTWLGVLTGIGSIKYRLVYGYRWQMKVAWVTFAVSSLTGCFPLRMLIFSQFSQLIIDSRMNKNLHEWLTGIPIRITALQLQALWISYQIREFSSQKLNIHNVWEMFYWRLYTLSLYLDFLRMF